MDCLTTARPLSPRRLRLTVLACFVGLSGARAWSAEATYPFEGTWAQPEHVCAAGATRVRTYTAKDVISPRGRCSIRRIAAGSGAFELFEECRHDREPLVTEMIRMTSPDSLVLRRQVKRLKIPRQLRFVRCSVAAPAATPAAAPSPPRPVGKAFPVTPDATYRTP